VLLDVSYLDASFVRKRFPNIYRQCLRYGFDITQRAIPVVPAAHYACGGVLADITGETPLPGLYAAGEVAMTGMHGANRLASNSLLESVVMAEFAADRSVEYRRKNGPPPSALNSHPPGKRPGAEHEKILIAHYRRDVQRTMSDFVGIVRIEERLRLALGKVRRVKFAVDEFFERLPLTYRLAELRNMAQVAELIILSALSRHESRGLHYLEDVPEAKTEFEKDTVLARDSDGEDT
jgi:L-aspartate oxidase